MTDIRFKPECQDQIRLLRTSRAYRLEGRWCEERGGKLKKKRIKPSIHYIIKKFIKATGTKLLLFLTSKFLVFQSIGDSQ